MKIGIICTRFNPKLLGGVERVVLELSKSFILKGHKVIIICKREQNEPVKEVYEKIKIDVEGAEVDVLKGAQRTLKNSHPKIIFETWNEEYLKKVKGVLEPFNYKIKKIAEENYLAY